LQESIKNLEEYLKNNDISSEDREKEQLNLSEAKGNLKSRMQEKKNIDDNIGRYLIELSNAIKNDKKTLVEVYSNISSLSADEIISSMEMIMKDE
jgi:hypothetical protein